MNYSRRSNWHSRLSNPCGLALEQPHWRKYNLKPLERENEKRERTEERKGKRRIKYRVNTRENFRS